MMKRFCLLFLSAVVSLSLFARSDKLYKNVVSSRDGSVWIKGIPQVNQKRNYCVPACVSMVVRYFDSKISQKRLGKLFETDSRKGTLSQDFEDAFKSAHLEGFALKSLYSLTQKDYEKMMELYQGASSKKRKRREANDDKSSNPFDNVDRETARKVFPVARPHLEPLMVLMCKRYIDSGVPVLWSVAMNLDPAVKMKGGHMRLIVGYKEHNNKIKKILYRDPWGGNTKIKQIDFVDAQVMTMQLYVVLPGNFSELETGVFHEPRKSVRKRPPRK